MTSPSICVWPAVSEPTFSGYSANGLNLLLSLIDRFCFKTKIVLLPSNLLKHAKPKTIKKTNPMVGLKATSILSDDAPNIVHTTNN